MVRRVIAALLFFSWFDLTAATRGCPGSSAVGTFQLRVQPPGGGPGRSIRRVNILASGSKIFYQPGELPANVRKDAKVTLVVAPPGTEEDPSPSLTVLELRPAVNPAEWTAPFRIGTIILVFGPQGLDEKRVTNLVTKDEELVAQLADYAEQTADLEATVEALTAIEQQADWEEVEPRPSGTPSEQALLALLRAFNPGATAYNPLGPGRVMSPVSLRGKAAAGFFENAGAVVPGGGVLPGLKSWLFPDTEFRAAFVQPAAADTLTLCAQRSQAKSRNRMAFLWAHRLVNADAPALSLAATAHLPIGARASLAVKARNAAEWQLAGRFDEWTLVSQPEGRLFGVPVRPALQGRALEVDLRKFAGPPGTYRLRGKWDWSEIQLPGEIQLDPLPDLKSVQVSADSATRLVESSGVVTVKLTGADFHFVEKASLKNANGRVLKPIEVDSKSQQALEFDLDTTGTKPGRYLLALTQAGGATQEVPVRVLPASPRLDNLPLRVNLGDAQQKLVLRGSGLQRIQEIRCDRAKIQLARAGGDGNREATVQLAEGARKGESLALLLKVDGLDEPLRLPDALQVLGPRPRIASVKASLPDDLGIAVRPGELPAGSFVTFSARLENADSWPQVHLQCAQAVTLRSNVTFSAKDQSLFFSFDPGAAGPPGCELTARVETESAGASDPAPLGRIVRLPRLESFALTEEKLEGSAYAAVLRGQDLETIEKTGWDAQAGLPVPALPAPIAGAGPRQTLRIAMPWPSPVPHAALYVWLRGEPEGRATKVKY